MDYARFVQARRPVWDAFERQLAAAGQGLERLSHRDLEDLALRYRQVLHDHALAAARYPGTAAAQRLADLALEGTRRLTRQSGGRTSLVGFLTATFPAAFRRQLPLLGVAAGLFAAAALAGLLAGTAQPGLAVAVLGPEAVTGLAQGHLWTESLTTVVPPSVSGAAIATNNISVALLAWSGGALAGFLSLWIVLLNGVLLGLVFAVTGHYSMAGELGEFVAAHGPLEITLILVAAAAGLALGRALVAASDRPRAVELREAARDALVVLLGSLPWFLLLGAVEATVSPSPHVPLPLKVALGLGLETVYLVLALGLLGGRRRRPAPGTSEEIAHGAAAAGF